LALVLSGIGHEDEVIMPAQTFVATGLAVSMQGARPVFADIQGDSGNIDPRSIPAKITERTKAIIAVHWGGYPCDLSEISAIAHRHDLVLLEDAAQALGATYNGRPIGSISRFTAFSFQAIKHLTTGDGGALCCGNAGDADEAFVKRWFGIDRANSVPSILGERTYDIQSLGYKYHMNDVAAAIGLGNLSDFGPRLARRQEIGAFYRERLTNVAGLELLRIKPDRTHAYWLFTVLVERRQDFIRKLKLNGVPASVVHLRIDRNTVFGGVRDDLTAQSEFDNRQIAIPLHERLSDEQIERIASLIRGGW
jgi:perosamine synthetase